MNINADTVLRSRPKQLQPTFLEVLDESAQHAGHSGRMALAKEPISECVLLALNLMADQG
jgi:stress-induced morphogen